MFEAFEGREQLLRLLREALELVDSLAFAPPEIGARLQEVIDLTDSDLPKENSTN